MKKLTILKIGGKLLDQEAAWKKAMTDFSKIKGAKILVHGGGKMTTTLCKKLEIETKMIEGRRITDAASLEVATMVYAGLLNKKLVSFLQFLKENAIGFSGADGNLISSKKRSIKQIDFGFVGDIEKINTDFILSLLNQNFVPVFCAITHDGQGQLLNTNADTIAATLATNLAPYFQTTLKFCFEKEGVLKDPLNEADIFAHLSKEKYLEECKKGVISAGMIPKLENAFAAKKTNVHQVIICGTTGINQPKGTEICL